jgi:hypothetical protein
VEFWLPHLQQLFYWLISTKVAIKIVNIDTYVAKAKTPPDDKSGGVFYVERFVNQLQDMKMI